MLGSRRGGSGECLDAQRRNTYDLVGAGGDTDSCLINSRQDFAADAVFQAADVVGPAEEANGELHPVVGDAQIDTRSDIGGFDEEALFKAIELRLGEVGDLGYCKSNTMDAM